MKHLLTTIAVTTTFTFAPSLAKADTWLQRNPWSLKTPVVAQGNQPHAGFFKRVVFQGTGSSLIDYVRYWDLRVQLLQETESTVRTYSIGTGRLWASCFQTMYLTGEDDVTCVAIDRNGRALDRNIYLQNYRTSVFDQWHSRVSKSHD